jgi:hypothetical protein
MCFLVLPCGIARNGDAAGQDRYIAQFFEVLFNLVPVVVKRVGRSFKNSFLPNGLTRLYQNVLHILLLIEARQPSGM